MNLFQPHFENMNVCPITFHHFENDEMYRYTEEQLASFVTMVIRARDWLRPRERTLLRQNNRYWLPVYETFFDASVNLRIEQILQDMLLPQLPRPTTERLVRDIYFATNRRYGQTIDPFRKLPADFQSFHRPPLR